MPIPNPSFTNLRIVATYHGSPEYWGPLRDVFHQAATAEQGADPHETIDDSSSRIAAWVDPVTTAFEACEPAKISFATAPLPGLAFNRRYHRQDGSVKMNPGSGNPDVVRPAGPVDADLPVLLFRRSDDEATPMGSLTTFAMHTAVAGGREFTADFPAILTSRLRERFGSGSGAASSRFLLKGRQATSTRGLDGGDPGSDRRANGRRRDSARSLDHRSTVRSGPHACLCP